jgi:hypothetical protein
MSPRFSLVTLFLLMFLFSGCSKLKEKLTEKDPNAAGPTTGPAATQRVVGLQPGWELGTAAKYSATQSTGEVTITARGENPSAGYETKLVTSPLRIWPPQQMLAVKKPDGPAAAVMTPFEVKASFKADDPVETVSVRDASGLHKVTVEKSTTP